MLRYFSVLIFFLCSCLPMWGQEQQWHEPFLIDIGLTGGARLDMQIDNAGNIYVISIFEDEVTILDTTLYSSKDDGVFLAKFDADHNLLWSKVIAEAKEATPDFSRVINNVYIETNESNFIYPIVEYKDSIYLDNQLFTVIQSEYDYQDISIFKMSSTGQVEDMYHLKGSCRTGYGGIKAENDELYFHVLNRRNNLDTTSTCTCVIDSDTTIYSEKNEAILGKINQDNHSVDWIKVYGAGGSPIIAEEIALNESNLYLTGNVFSSLDLVIDSDSLIVLDTYSRYGYVARFDKEGGHKWSKYFAVKGWDSHGIPSDLEINSDNDIVLVANIKTQSEPNKVYFQNAPTLTGAQNNDESFFIVNYDSLGNIKWHDISNSIGYEVMYSVDFDSYNNLYLTGTYTNQITFGNTVLEANSFSNDVLVISYDEFGNKRWAQKAGGNGSDVGVSLGVDSSNNLHIMGGVTSSATFGVHQSATPNSSNAIFVAQMKLEPIGLFETTPQQFGVSVYPNPSIGITHIEVVDEFISQVKIYNGFGQEIKNLNFDSQTENVSVENLPNGYYILDIHVGSGKHVAQKLIVK